ncbi:MAG: MBL fold metallo-hydrolase [Salinisphaeraceae bacterium]|nr:MBL fold metallo-hydrolase [Salinisphaeraceae bacterium]
MQYSTLQKLSHDITRVDTAFQRPGFAACYLIRSGNKAAFVDTGTNYSVPNMLSALAEHDLEPEDVQYIIPTHVHLDHAGGAGEMMRQCRNAELVIHPRGAPHMIDPSKLVAGATAVYGEQEMRNSYGEILPIAEDRVLVTEDGQSLDLNGRALLFLHTEGHAKHHFCIYDEASNGFFTGDTFGLSYRELDTDRGAFVLPTTTPVQFDPEAWQDSITRLMSYGPTRMYLTHFGMVEEVAQLASDLKSRLRDYVHIARKVEAGPERHKQLVKALTRHAWDALQRHGCKLNESELHNLLGMDMILNAQGIEVWLDRQARQDSN